MKRKCSIHWLAERETQRNDRDYFSSDSGLSAIRVLGHSGPHSTFLECQYAGDPAVVKCDSLGRMASWEHFGLSRFRIAAQVLLAVRNWHEHCQHRPSAGTC